LLEVGTGFNPELTGRENTYLNGTILGMTRKEVARKFDEIVAFSGVEKFIDTPVKRYSSGMKVRLGFAVAAHLEPEILIVDEVLAVGDAEFQKKCIGKMQGISSEEGRTVLFVSHDMSAIGSICQKCLLLERGQLDMIGDTAAVVHKYTRNITDNSLDADASNTIKLLVEEVTADYLDVNAFFKINEDLCEFVLHIRLYDGANSELVFYREKDIEIRNNESVRIRMDVSSLKGGYYTLQVRYTGSKVQDRKTRVTIHSDFVPVMYQRADTIKYDKGQIAPRIELHNTTRNMTY
jgi:lipopolysaccharide transport system ATP-binding protein